MAERHDGGGGGGGGKGGKILSMTVKRARRVQEKVRIYSRLAVVRVCFLTYSLRSYVRGTCDKRGSVSSCG